MSLAASLDLGVEAIMHDIHTRWVPTHDARRALLMPSSGVRVGLGHVGRCAALAQALTELGWEARLFLTDRGAAEFARTLGVAITTDAQDASSVAVVVVDSYLDPSRQAAAFRTSGTRVAVVDDLHQVAVREVDLIVRPSIGERSGRRLLGGAEYVLLRREYWRRRHRDVPRVVKRVLVALGGYPDPDVVRTAAEVLCASLPTATIEVVGLGEADGFDRRVRFSGRVASLFPALRRADLVLAAGGQTLNEALTTGSPTIVLGTASNQRRQIGAVRRAGAAEVIGWASNPRWPGRLRASLAELSQYSSRSAIAQRAERLVDGAGALRVARAIAEL